MSMIWLLGAALAGNAVLHVGVHQRAGDLYNIAADGAAGQCVVAGCRIACPADGPVTFRWGPGGDWRLEGDTVVDPGMEGVAHVVPVEGSSQIHLEELDRLGGDFDALERSVLMTGANTRADDKLLNRLNDLASHSDWRIRLRVIRALTPYWRHGPTDPYVSCAPPLLDSGKLRAFAADKDFHVRRALAVSAREVPPDSAYAKEAREVLLLLQLDTMPQVRRAAIRTSAAIRNDLPTARIAWDHAMEQVRQSGPPGRSAAVALAQLNGYLSGRDVNAEAAVQRTLEYQPEKTWKVWNAWREDVPFRATWAEVLFRETEGVSVSLVRSWASSHPSELANVLARWEPLEPHSRRYRMIAAVLADSSDPTLRALLTGGRSD